MAYHLFGGRPADFTYTTVPVGGVEVEVWDARTGGTRLTDLLLDNGTSTPGSAPTDGYFTSAADGTVTIWVQDTVGAVFVTGKNSVGTRWLLDPQNLNQRLKTVETGGGGGGAVTSVNGDVGAVTLTASDVGAVAVADKGVANGVASLGAGAQVPIAQIPVGTAAGTVMAGNVVLGIANLPAGSMVTQTWDGVGTTPNRVTARTDIKVDWWSPVQPSSAAGKALAGDKWTNTAP